MLFLGKLFSRRVERRIVLERRVSSTLTVNEWRATGDLLVAARKVLDNPDFRLMIDTIRNTSFDLLGDPTIEQRAMRQAEASGFNLAIAMLLSLGTPLPSQEMPKETWGAPDDLKTED